MTIQDVKDMTEGYKTRGTKIFKELPNCTEDDKILFFWLEEQDMHTVKNKFKVSTNRVLNILTTSGAV